MICSDFFLDSAAVGGSSPNSASSDGHECLQDEEEEDERKPMDVTDDSMQILMFKSSMGVMGDPK